MQDFGVGALALKLLGVEVWHLGQRQTRKEASESRVHRFRAYRLRVSDCQGWLWGL